jgi:hypothetical protein
MQMQDLPLDGPTSSFSFGTSTPFGAVRPRSLFEEQPSTTTSPRARGLIFDQNLGSAPGFSNFGLNALPLCNSSSLQSNCNVRQPFGSALPVVSSSSPGFGFQLELSCIPRPNETRCEQAPTKPMDFTSPIKKRKPNDVQQQRDLHPASSSGSSTIIKRKRGIEEILEPQAESTCNQEVVEKPIQQLQPQLTQSSSSSSLSILSSPNEVPQKHVKPKLIHKEPDAKDIPKVRLVFVRGSNYSNDPKDLVQAKILYKEPWGVMVVLTESKLELGMRRGQRFWTKFTGTVHPISNIPILEAIHTC